MALYHKYRPQKFIDVVDQSHIITTLQSQVKLGKVAHAYLFSGPRGVGKTTTARILAKAMNCTARGDDNEPCGACSSCTEVTAGRSIDVIEIDAASNTGVDHVREHIIENAQFKPTSSKFKIFIIDEVHMLSTSAFNALLKTLEEPPAHIVFILATTELHKIPETILSRCQRFHFKKIPYDVMKIYLRDIAKNEHITIEEVVLDRVIVKADGCARDAISLVDQLMATGESAVTSDTAALILPLTNREDTLAFLTALANQQARDGFGVLHSIEESGTNIAEFMEDAIRLLQLLLIMHHTDTPSAEQADMSDAMKQKMKSLDTILPPRQVVALIDILLRRKQDMRYAPTPILPLEMAIVEWCDSSSPTPTTPVTPPTAPISAPTPVVTPTPAATIPPAPTPSKPEPIKSEPTKETLPPPPITAAPVPVAQPVVPEQKIEPAAATPTTTGPLDVEAVKKAWVATYKQLEDRSPSLSSVLKAAVFSTINGDTILFTMPFAFYRDTIMENKEQHRKIETLLSSIVGQNVHIDMIVDAPPEEEPADLTSLTAVFGGQVVG